jgi:hypothetical protein
MLIEEIEKDKNFLQMEVETRYKKIVEINPLLEKRIAIKENELSNILRSVYMVGTGVSLGTLQNKRKDSVSVSYLQVVERGRVLYPTIFLYEEFNETTIANKATFLNSQIKKIVGKNTLAINQSTLSKLLGIESGTIINWIEQDASPKFYREKGKVMFNVTEVVRWILLNSKMTMLYDEINSK